MYSRILFLLLLSSPDLFASPITSSGPQKQQEPSIWSQDKGILVHESEQSQSPVTRIKKSDDSDSAETDSDSLLSFASAYDIQKSSVPLLASRFSEPNANVYTTHDNNAEASYEWTPYEHNQAPTYTAQPPVERRVDSYENIPIVNGIASKIYSTPQVTTINRGYINSGQSSVAPPTAIYASPSPPTYHVPYGPPPSHYPPPPPSDHYGPVEEEREIRFVVHKPGDEGLVKQTLSEKAKWNNEHATFVKGPQFQIEQNQKVHLPPRPKMVVYILLKEPKVNTQVQVQGDPMENLPKPEVFIMYERANGVEQVHHDLAKDKPAVASTGYNSNNFDSYNNLHLKRDTSLSDKGAEPRSDTSSLEAEAASSKDEPSTSSSNNDNVIVKKPNVVCTATM